MMNSFEWDMYYMAKLLPIAGLFFVLVGLCMTFLPFRWAHIILVYPLPPLIKKIRTFPLTIANTRVVRALGILLLLSSLLLFHEAIRNGRELHELMSLPYR